MKINIHSGHNPQNKVASGAVGYISESEENRKVVGYLSEILRNREITVFDCTVSDGTSQQDVLNKIVDKCNANEVDLDVSIHFNSGISKDIKGKTTGVECYIYDEDSKAKNTAAKICSNIERLGYKNRGVKVNDFYYLKKVKAPAILVECCFVDDEDDINIYNAYAMALAIADGIYEMEENLKCSCKTYSYMEIPEYAKPTIDKLVDNGYLVGDGENIELSNCSIINFVVNDRVGLYKNL